MQDIDQGQLDEIKVFAGIMHDEKGEDVEVVEPGGPEDKSAVDAGRVITDLSTEKAKIISFTGTTLSKRSSLMLVGGPIQSAQMDSER